MIAVGYATDYYIRCLGFLGIHMLEPPSNQPPPDVGLLTLLSSALAPLHPRLEVNQTMRHQENILSPFPQPSVNPTRLVVIHENNEAQAVWPTGAVRIFHDAQLGD